MRSFLTLALAAALASGCSAVTYDSEVKRTAATPAKFSGEVAVYWLEEGDPNSGDGLFLYVPMRRAPLKFNWTDGEGRAHTTTPGVMYTDGGSIPRIAQGISGYSPWGYAPAYMVHDWVFEARQCLTDNDATEDQKTDAAISFDDSVRIMAQSIAALDRAGRIQRKTSVPSVITAAVGSPISRQLWTGPGLCANGEELDKLRKKYDALANGGDGSFASAARAAGAQGKLVGLISF